MILALVLVAGLAGCVKFTAGHPFAEEALQDTPSAAVQKYFSAMQNSKDADENVRNQSFQDYMAVTDPNYFKDPTTGQPIPDGDINALRAAWTTTDTADPHYWKADFMDVQFAETQNDGTNAVVEVNGGLIQYTGKELFGTSEIKVDNFKDKPGRITLRKIGDKWYITGGGEVNASDNWPPASTP